MFSKGVAIRIAIVSTTLNSKSIFCNLMRKPESNIIDLLKNEYFVKWIIHPSEESSHYWEKWIQANPDRYRDVSQARELLNSVKYKRNNLIPEKEYNYLLENIVSYNRSKKQKTIRQFYIQKKYLAVAAVLLLAFFLSFWVMSLKDVGSEITVSANNKTEVSKATARGQKLTFKLPDGSTIMLNSESSVTYKEPFESNRQVKLIGEAFFDIERDVANPFTISSGTVLTKVLGTSFNIKAYPEANKSIISVLTGKVLIADQSGNEASLLPNTKGIFQLEKKELLIEQAIVADEVAWKDGVIVFENKPLSDVVLMLERWYGVDIQVKEKDLLQGKYTGYYSNASLEKVLDGLSYTSGFDYSLQDKTVIITKKK